MNEQTKVTTDYDWWQAALAGDIEPIHESDPQPGFYRSKKKEGGYELAAIWRDADGEIKQKPANCWTWCCKNPVSEADYRAVEAGGEWPDAVPGLSNNPPSDDRDVLEEEIQNAKSLADAIKEISDQKSADQAQNLRDRLNTLSKKADGLRKVEKQPHLDAGNAVQAKWAPLVNDAKDAADGIRDMLTAYARKLKAEEDARQQEAEQKRIAEIEAAAKEAEKQGEDPAKAAAKAAAETTPDPEPDKPATFGGSYGKKASMRTVTSAKIVDFDKALMALKDHAEMRELVQKLANRAAKAGAPLAGVEIVKDEVVV